MALSIEDAEAERLARELAKRTGETLTAAVVTALRERLQREKGPFEPHVSAKSFASSASDVRPFRCSMDGRRTRSSATTRLVFPADGPRHLRLARDPARRAGIAGLDFGDAINER